MSKYLYIFSKTSSVVRMDGHAHVFMRRLPMSHNRRYTPSRDASPTTYRKLLTTAGFSGALLVQPSFLGTDNRYLIKILRNQQGERRFFGVCVLSPTASWEHLTDLADAGVVGARLNLIGCRAPDLNAACWRKFMERIDKLGWHLEICAEGARLAKLLPPALAVCRRVVVDHFGLPEPSAPLKCVGWRTMLSAKGRLWVKTSAPYRVFPGMRTDAAVEQCAILADALREHIGADRIVWGSDWPWTRHESGLTFSRAASWREKWLASGEDGMVDLLRDAIKTRSDMRL